MIDGLRLVFIVLIIATDDIVRETVLSFNTTYDFVRYRLRWIVRDKVRTLWRRSVR
jgi:hypothetical protein